MKRVGQAVAVAALACSSAALADVLVIRSTSNTYYAGQRLGESERLQLRAGEQVLVLQNRRTRRLCGPATVRLSQRAGGCAPRGRGGVRVGAVSASQIDATQAAGLLVLRSVGPRAPRLFRPGTRVAPTARLELRPGDAVTLLQPGGSREFHGPGFFTASQPPRLRRRFRTGAPANAEPITPEFPPDVWHVDTRVGGRICARSGQRVELWRPRAGETEHLTLAGDGAPSTELVWAAGQQTLPLPEPLVRDGASIALSSSAGTERRYDVAVIPTDALEDAEDELEARASALVAFGCRNQLDVLVAIAPVRAEGAPGYGTPVD